ncbi:MAG TPA: hypothetical protein VJ953_21745 [Saprospiraceae bacterium]|nr:hypothetical protein [Saprospiraceae bacterium]
MKNNALFLIMTFLLSTSLGLAQEVALKLNKPLSEADFKRVQSILRSFDQDSYQLIADVRTRKGLQTARLGKQDMQRKRINPATRDIKQKEITRNTRTRQIQANRGLANVKQINSQVYLNREGFAAATNTKYNIFRQLKAAGTNTEWNVFKAMGTNTKYNIFKPVAATNTKYNIFKPTNQQLTQMDALYKILAKYQ